MVGTQCGGLLVARPRGWSSCWFNLLPRSRSLTHTILQHVSSGLKLSLSGLLLRPFQLFYWGKDEKHFSLVL